MSTFDKDSDAFAAEYENQTSQQYLKIDKFYPEFRKNVQQLFNLHSEEAKKSLALIFTNQDNINTYKNVPEFAYLYEIMQIYIWECNSGYGSSILDCIDNIPDFVRLIEQAKFILWRIEFIKDGESQVSLVNFINNFNLSPYFIAEVVRTTAFTDTIFQTLYDIFNKYNLCSFVPILRKVSR